MGRKIILLADDDPFVRRVVEMTFGSDYETLHANDGLMAMDLIRAQHPDLVLMDIDMPGLNGIDACSMVKADPATQSVRVIILTGVADLEQRQVALGVGADGLFTKPFSPLDLLDTVRQVLN
ncbi:MAG: response regulator [Chloroflexi bacterium]|nr:response regulator [Chloroflexota bacterium]